MGPMKHAMSNTGERIQRLCAPTPTRAPQVAKPVNRNLDAEFNETPADTSKGSLVYHAGGPGPVDELSLMTPVPSLSTPVAAPATPPAVPEDRLKKHRSMRVKSKPIDTHKNLDGFSFLRS